MKIIDGFFCGLFFKSSTCYYTSFMASARMVFSIVWGLPSPARGECWLVHFIGLSPIASLHLSDHVENRRFTLLASVDIQNQILHHRQESWRRSCVSWSFLALQLLTKKYTSKKNSMVRKIFIFIEIYAFFFCQILVMIFSTPANFGSVIHLTSFV